MTGLASSEKIVGKTDFDLPWTKEQTESYLADDREVMGTNRAKIHLIEALHDGKGSSLLVDTTKVPLTDGSGQVYGVLGVFDDITEQKVAEAKIKRLSVLYAALSETSQAIVRSNSADELLESVCRIVVEQGEMKLAWIGMADADGKVRVQTAYGPAIDYLSGLEVSSNAGDPLSRGPTGTAIREGKPFWCDSFQSDARTAPWHERAARFGWKSTAAIPLRLRGKTIGALTIYDDMSEVFDEDVRRLFVEMEKTIGFALDHFANEDERKTTEGIANRLAAIVESSDDAIIGKDLNGIVTSWNRGAETIFGYTAAEMVGAPILRLIPADRQQEEQGILERIRGGKKIEHFETRRLTKDGRLLDVSVTVSPIRDAGGKVIGVSKVAHDITERKRVEASLATALLRAEASAAAKSEFLAIMSHELRTPLNGVLGFAQLLSDTLLDSEQMDYAKTISKSGEHLLAIVSDILDFSSIDAGALAIHAAPLAVADLVKTAEDTVRKTAREKGLELRCELAAGVPQQITGDEQRIRQILINLLGNAVKFTAGGSVILRVATAAEGRFLDFCVEDSGIGISSEKFGQLFQPFVQADSKMNRRFGGTGLGLAISRRIAEAMGGTITVASTPGKGSTFTFRFPLESTPVRPAGIAPVPSHLFIGADGVSPSSPSAETPVRPDASQLFALVVDDDNASGVVAVKMLQKLGHHADYVADGAKAVQAFLPGKYSAIFMDVAMPVMDGLVATRKIREIEAGTSLHVPIIAFTANVMPGDRERCLAAGMDDFLPKPFKQAELAEKLACVTQR